MTTRAWPPRHPTERWMEGVEPIMRDPTARVDEGGECYNEVAANWPRTEDPSTAGRRPSHR